MLAHCYDKLSVSENIIKEKIKSSQVGHVDETGIRVANKLQWLHVFSTQLETYLFPHTKRGKEAINSDQSIIPDFKNWLVHDCWASYFNFKDSKHALCNAHILRELQAVVDNDKKGVDSWAKKDARLSNKLKQYGLSGAHKKSNDNQQCLFCHMQTRTCPRTPTVKTKCKKRKNQKFKSKEFTLQANNA